LDCRLKRGIINLGDNMKKIALMLVMVLILSACGAPTTSVTNEHASGGNPLEMASGPTCPPYTPEGQVVYDAQWSGEYPQIEKYDKAYATATFGLG